MLFSSWWRVWLFQGNCHVLRQHSKPKLHMQLKLYRPQLSALRRAYPWKRIGIMTKEMWASAINNALTRKKPPARVAFSRSIATYVLPK